MVFGMGAKHSAPKAKSKTKAGGRSAEAAAVMKKMQAKKDAGNCAFC